MDLEIGMFRCLVATEEERLGIQPGDKIIVCFKYRGNKDIVLNIVKRGKPVGYIMCQATP